MQQISARLILPTACSIISEKVCYYFQYVGGIFCYCVSYVLFLETTLEPTDKISKKSYPCNSIWRVFKLPKIDALNWKCLFGWWEDLTIIRITALEEHLLGQNWMGNEKWQRTRGSVREGRRTEEIRNKPFPLCH